jgi:2TM domain
MPVATSATYSQEDIQQILQIAFSRQVETGDFSREQLLEIAAELGISAQLLQSAEQEWLQQQGWQHKRQDFDRYRQHQLRKSGIKYLIVNSFLLILNGLTGFGFPWAVYVLIFWGMGLSLHVWNVFGSKGEDYEQAFQQWYRRHQFRHFVNGWAGKLGRLLSA